jgi:hypothetical protein
MRYKNTSYFHVSSLRQSSQKQVQDPFYFNLHQLSILYKERLNATLLGWRSTEIKTLGGEFRLIFILLLLCGDGHSCDKNRSISRPIYNVRTSQRY